MLCSLYVDTETLGHQRAQKSTPEVEGRANKVRAELDKEEEE